MFMAIPTTPAAPFAPIAIGTTPGGNEWIAYRADAVDTMRARLADLHARHNAKQAAVSTRRVKLTTEAQHDMVLRFLAADSTATVRRTYIEATDAELSELAELVDGETDDAMTDAAECSMGAQTEQETAFAAIAGGMSCVILAARLRGKSIDKRAARARLAREWN